MLREVGRLGSVNMLKLCGCVCVCAHVRVLVHIFSFAISRATEPCTFDDRRAGTATAHDLKHRETGKKPLLLLLPLPSPAIHVYSCCTRNRLLSTVKHNTQSFSCTNTNAVQCTACIF